MSWRSYSSICVSPLFGNGKERPNPDVSIHAFCPCKLMAIHAREYVHKYQRLYKLLVLLHLKAFFLTIIFCLYKKVRKEDVLLNGHGFISLLESLTQCNSVTLDKNFATDTCSRVIKFPRIHSSTFSLNLPTREFLRTKNNNNLGS